MTCRIHPPDTWFLDLVYELREGHSVRSSKGQEGKVKRKLNQELIYMKLKVEDGDGVFLGPSFGGAQILSIIDFLSLVGPIDFWLIFLQNG